jgi:KGK domain
VKYANSTTKDLSFFTPDKFENVMKTTQGEEAYRLISNEAYELINNKVECRILVPSKEWQNGEIGLFLVFCPEQENINISDVQTESANSSLDGIRKSIAEISPLDEIRQLSNELASVGSIDQN